ncbi:hypothetical protein Clacol_008643 [Clathrus columnatus]|uniref:Aminoglycoside phosphotransferase domain-containing protein n=1 Tax=Clathrus columnatus TaxID=1419009 RepID=A0AAV5ANY0_9AGAM|nr:hypothetical protein Clacol_008643 [Clathrus columnatus]
MFILCTILLFIQGLVSGSGIKPLTVSSIRSTTLGLDPPTVNRLNGESFQQDAIATFNGYQYSVFYGSTPTATETTPRHVSIARRTLTSDEDEGPWEIITFSDYNQTDDDGHDIISFGICYLDGTIHMAFDQHDNNLNYRISKPGVATNPGNIVWSTELFEDIQVGIQKDLNDFLPGLESINRTEHFESITYPRFLSLPSGDLLLEMRVGRSGLGDDWLYTYSGKDGKWTDIGRYLEGVQNNAYINGIDLDTKGNLQVSWTYRDYVNDTGQDVAVEAGPNGPENNHDMDFGYSSDLGTTWKNTWGQTIGDLTTQSPILPNSPGITIFSIPKYGGILNQEAQTIDEENRIHVLNRENTTGTELWYHYWRSTQNDWKRKRGKVVAYKSNLIMILPDNAPNSTALTLISSTAEGHFRDWRTILETDGNGWEPVFDRYRLAGGVLIMKVEEHDHNTEGASLQLLNRSGLNLPIPKLVDYFFDRGKTYTIMTRIPGQSLKEVWDKLSDSELHAINTDISNVLYHLWTLQQPASDAGKVMMGATGHGLPNAINQFHSELGPCSSILDLYYNFSTHPREGNSWTPEDYTKAYPEAVATVSADRVVWVHTDLRPYNILVRNGRLSGIIDWENSGWLPCHWQLYVFRRPRGYPDRLRLFWERFEFPSDVENAFRLSAQLLDVYPI